MKGRTAGGPGQVGRLFPAGVLCTSLIPTWIREGATTPVDLTFRRGKVIVGTGAPVFHWLLATVMIVTLSQMVLEMASLSSIHGKTLILFR